MDMRSSAALHDQSNIHDSKRRLDFPLFGVKLIMRSVPLKAISLAILLWYKGFDSIVIYPKGFRLLEINKAE